LTILLVKNTCFTDCGDKNQAMHGRTRKVPQIAAKVLDKNEERDER